MPVKAATTGLPAAAEHSASTPAILSTVSPRAGSRATTTAWTASRVEGLLQAAAAAPAAPRTCPASRSTSVDDAFHAQPVGGRAVRHHLAQRPGVAEHGHAGARRAAAGRTRSGRRP